MRTKVVKRTENTCEAQTENGLLVVFAFPRTEEVRLNDALEFGSLKLDAETEVTNVIRGHRFAGYISATDAHDLRLPDHHGSSRTPSQARLREQ